MVDGGLDLSAVHSTATFNSRQDVQRSRQALKKGQLHVADDVHRLYQASRRCLTAATSLARLINTPQCCQPWSSPVTK
jgi:hypothetical protein